MCGVGKGEGQVGEGSSEVMGSGCMAPRKPLQEMWKMAQKDYYAFFFLIEVELIYNVVLVSAVQQSDSVIPMYTSFSVFFSIMLFTTF